LYEEGQLDVLKKIKAREITIREVYDARRKRRPIAASASLRKNLWDAVEAWVERSGPTAGRYAVSFNQLSRSGVLPSSAQVSALAGIDWSALRDNWQGGPSDWNHLRRAVSRFCSVLLGDVHHPFRREIMKVIPLQHEVERVPDLRPHTFWEIVKRTPDHVQPCYVTLAATGMRVGEYLRCTESNLLPLTKAIHVPGTKTGGSEAPVQVDPEMWTWIERAIPSPVQYKWLREHFKRAAREVGLPDLRLHDLRHCFGQWAIDGGIPESKVQVAMRHADPSMTRRYTKQRDRGEHARVIGDVMLRRGA
jgi:integrase